MPQTAIIKHGDFTSAYEYDSPRLKLRSDDLDSLTLYFAAPTKNAFTKGQAAPSPWGSFQVVDLDVEQDADEWLFQLQCEGLMQAVSRRMKGGYRETNVLADWDTYEDRWIAAAKDRFTKGQRVGNFVCTSASNIEKLSGVALWETSGSFVGLRSGAGTRRRTVQSNGQVITGDNITVNLENGWATGRKGQASLPKIVITDTYPSLSLPATQSVPSLRTPPNAPPVRAIVFSGSDRREVWPGGGWAFTCGYDQPFGLSVPLYMATETYEFQLRYLPA
jgi:hypothetical protein